MTAFNQKDPKPTRLTVAELRKHKGFENFTDQEAEEAITSLAIYADILYHNYTIYKNSDSSK